MTKEEQLARFKRREADPSKSWKISDEDWRNRRRWDEHNAAAEEMFERTSSAGRALAFDCGQLQVARAVGDAAGDHPGARGDEFVGRCGM